jgi:CDP-paratose 2-epimerase
MNILITGGCGFVGSNIALFLKSKKYKVFTLDNFFRKGSKFNHLRLQKENIHNYCIDVKNQKKLFKLKKFDLIIDCCADPSIESSKINIRSSFDNNLSGTLNILLKCIKDKSKIIFLSTSRVYSIESINALINKKIIKSKILPKELIKLNFDTSGPKSLYGFAKNASEELIKEFSYAFGLKYLINRCGVVAGPWQFGRVDQGFISHWIWSHIFKKKLNYIGFGGYGNQVRDILHIDDLCELIFKQINKINLFKNKTFLVCGGRKNAISLRDLTNMCESLSGNTCKIYKKKKTSIYDISYFVGSNEVVTNVYKWSPKRSVEKILKDVYRWQLNNIRQLKNILN